jgi:hypothetical protein
MIATSSNVTDCFGGSERNNVSLVTFAVLLSSNLNLILQTLAVLKGVLCRASSRTM